MKLKDARRWIAIYFLLTTALTGSFLLLFSGSVLLPLAPEDASASFQILIPVLVGQVTIIFQWLALANNDPAQNDVESPIPGWAIKLPPALAFAIFVLAAIVLALANRPDLNWNVSPGTFKNAVTFAVTILNASTMFLVARLFPQAKP
jgi:hypothetical protein